MPGITRTLTGSPNWVASAQEAIKRLLGKDAYIVLSETRTIRLLQQEFRDTKEELRSLLRSDELLRGCPGFVRQEACNGRVSFLTETAARCPAPVAMSKRTVTNDKLGLLEIEEIIYR